MGQPVLQARELPKQRCVGAIVQGIVLFSVLRRMESFQALGLVYNFTLIAEQHRIAIKGYPYLAIWDRFHVGGRLFYQSHSTAVAINDSLGVFGVGGQEEVDIVGIQIVHHRLTSGERRAGDIQTVFTDIVKHPHSGFRAVARHYHHFHQWGFVAGLELVQGEKGLNQVEPGAGLQRFRLTSGHVITVLLDGLFSIGFELTPEYCIRFAQIKQRSCCHTFTLAGTLKQLQLFGGKGHTVIL